MTRKRFFKLRQALVTRINERYDGTEIENHQKGKGFATLRNYNPLPATGCKSYQECWDQIKALCNVVHMEVRK